MIENYLEYNKRIELDTFGSNDVAELLERKPDSSLYKKNKEGEIVRDEGSYFFRDNIEMLHSFYLDLSQVIPESEVCHSGSTVLARSETGIRHELVAGGSAEVGVLQSTLSQEQTSVVRRGYVRMLYQTKEHGSISEVYILCDVGIDSFSKEKLEQRIFPKEDAPMEMMKRPGYLNLEEVSLDVIDRFI
ncbi:hypothetical protein HOA91_00860 [Candidatus Woesearchaeota archaeon]|jgi:hypothetical protein|nr:hypothetical protein [Candidatus Woesearchaeota archaeon]